MRTSFSCWSPRLNALANVNVVNVLTATKGEVRAMFGGGAIFIANTPTTHERSHAS